MMNCYRMDGWIPECQCELQRELKQSSNIPFDLLYLVLQSEDMH
jgi:hypothetical protein